jgi:hypothetical protein
MHDSIHNNHNREKNMEETTNTETPLAVNGYGICYNIWLEDDRIKNELRLLIKISSLCAEKGYCWAGNENLSKYFKTTTITISRQINKLIKLGYLTVDYRKKGAMVAGRKLRLTEMLNTVNKNVKRTVNKNVKDNSIRKDNIISNNKKSKPKKVYPSELNLEAWKLWQQHKKERGETYKPLGEKLAINKLIVLSSKNQMACLKDSMSNNYAGFFPAKFTGVINNEKAKLGTHERNKIVRAELDNERKKLQSEPQEIHSRVLGQDDSRILSETLGKGVWE